MPPTTGPRYRNPRITPIAISLSGYGQDGMGDPRTKVAGGIDCIPRGSSQGKADTPDEKCYGKGSESTKIEGNGCAA